MLLGLVRQLAWRQRACAWPRTAHLTHVEMVLCLQLVPSDAARWPERGSAAHAAPKSGSRQHLRHSQPCAAAA